LSVVWLSTPACQIPSGL